MGRVLKPADKSSQKKAAEVFIDFQYKAFALTFDALSKALAFYFLLLGACFTIVFQAKPSNSTLTVTLWFAVLVTLVTGVAFAVGVKGLLGSIRRLGHSMMTLDAKMFQVQNLDEHFARTRTYVIRVAILCGTVLALIVGFSLLVLASASPVKSPPPIPQASQQHGSAVGASPTAPPVAPSAAQPAPAASPAGP